MRFNFIKTQFLFGVSWTFGDPILKRLLGNKLFVHIGPFSITFGKRSKIEISSNVQDP